MQITLDSDTFDNLPTIKINSPQGAFSFRLLPIFLNSDHVVQSQAINRVSKSLRVSNISKVHIDEVERVEFKKEQGELSPSKTKQTLSIEVDVNEYT